MKVINRGRAFTLIELLVVVAIIALLISILLPTLTRAREQARIAKCLANQKSIGLAMASYLSEDKSNDLPWTLPFKFSFNGTQATTFFATEFIWGGGMPDRTAAQTAEAGVAYAYKSVTSAADTYIVPPRFRPLNPYVYPGVSFDAGNRDTDADRVRIPMELPDLFKCPSDRTVAVPSAGPNNTYAIETDNAAYPTWQNFGTSYAINWYWAYYWSKGWAPPADKPPYKNNLFAVLGYRDDNDDGVPDFKGLGPVLLKGSQGGWESRFVVFYENLFNYAVEAARPKGFSGIVQKLGYPGWHGNKDTYSGLYKDGHADYKFRDTRYPEGPGWTTWPSRPWGGKFEPY